MSDSKAPLGVLVVVLLVVGLYVASVVVGWGPGGGLAGCAPSTEKREDLHREGFLRPPAVEPADLTFEACTRTDDALRFQGACGITVAQKGRWGSRALTVVAGPQGLDVDFEPRGDDAVTIKPRIDGNKSAELMVPAEGAAITLRCHLPPPAGAFCTAALK